MTGINPLTMKCTYSTPCGWCTKWDKKCDRKIPDPPVKPYDYLKKPPTNQICKSEEDHQWECCGVSTGGFTYMCKICGKHKTEPVKSSESTITSTYYNCQTNTPCSECVHEDLDLNICDSCDVWNDFKYFEGWENTK